MSMIRESDRAKLRERLAKLPGEVGLVVFTQEMECDYCEKELTFRVVSGAKAPFTTGGRVRSSR